MAKYVFITGGVTSSLGKGITAASIGKLLKGCGYNVTIKKMDPYLNLHAGQLSPEQHGEIFVLKDGTEADLDLGNYERFLDEELCAKNTATSGKIYQHILEREQRGEYGGKTVQVIPHVTNEIKSEIYMLDEYDIVIVEIGGTVGDIEGLPYLEAVRQIRNEKGKKNTLFIHVTLLPYISAASELKSKPTQHSVKELRSIGIQPDILICRTSRKLTSDIREKLSSFCNVDTEAIIENRDVKSVYEVPIVFQQQELHVIIQEKLELPIYNTDICQWKDLVEKNRSVKGFLKIGIVGDYVKVPDAYLSIITAIKHAALHVGKNIVTLLIQNNKEDVTEYLNSEEIDGIILKDEEQSKGYVYDTCVNKGIPVFCFGLESMSGYIGGTYLTVKNEEISGAIIPGKDYRFYTKKIVTGNIPKGFTGEHLPDSNMILWMQSENKKVTAISYRADFTSRLETPDPLLIDFVKACEERKTANVNPEEI